MSYKVRNNGKVIGVASEFAYNVRRFNHMLGKFKYRGKLGVISGILVTTIIATPIATSRTNSAVNNALESQRESMIAALDFDMDEVGVGIEPEYILDYEVRGGDTLSGIIYSMITEDANLEKSYENRIVSMNGLSGASSITAGTILKIPVPESKLENFGYKVGYASINEYEKDLLNYLDRKEDAVYAINEDDSFYYQSLKEEYKELKSDLETLNRIERESTDEDALEVIESEEIEKLEEARAIVEEVNGKNGAYQPPIVPVDEEVVPQISMSR